MKKVLSILALLVSLSGWMHAQTVVFSENFNSLTPPNIPTGWVQHNVDGLTPASAVSSLMGSNAWVSTNHSSLVPAPGDLVMISNSWYNPPGTANDWLVTPNITIPNTGTTILSWKARAYDPNYPDGYLVKVITSGTDPSNYVTTTIATITAENTTWTERSANLNAWAGQTIRIAFQNNSNDMYLLGLNDVAVVQPAASDAQIVSVDVPKYVSTGTFDIQGVLKNLSVSNLTSATIYYSVNSGTPVPMNLTSINLAYGATYNFTHSTPLNITSPGTYNIKVWASALSTGPDVNPSNDTATAQMAAVSSVPVKRAILFEGTGAWCQFCPDGAVIMEQVLNTYPNAIGIAVHNGDGMAFTDGNTINSAFATGYPYGTVDHYKFPTDGPGLSRSVWMSRMGTRLNHIVPAEISGSHTYNPSTRQLNVTVTATFRAAVTGDFRLNCYVIQDSVIGPNNSQYNQANYYNTVAGHPYYGAGNPIVGFAHRHVLRACLGGPWGTAGSIPSTTADGGVYTQNYTYTIPNNYGAVAADVNKMYVVYAIQEYSSNVNARPVHNALQQKINVPTSVEPVLLDLQNTEVNVYPNPFVGQTHVQFNLAKQENVSIRILDLTGKEVGFYNQGTMDAGSYTITLDASGLAAGMYLMNINIGNQVITKKIEIQ
ncbi:MAG: choice-of-anchor J domain-containing protein [Bacteroidia bacterium]|nr:choice-of-anchor J domain-containing protein [Bacteroidia bacterium]